MKQTFMMLAAVAALITITGVLYKYPKESNKALQDPTSYLNTTVQTKIGDKREIKVGNIEILVEVADTNEKREKGLSGRKSISAGEGMLFIFDKNDFQPAFWMKGMLMPIDIIWINEDKIVQIDASVAPPDEGTSDKNLPLYIPKAPIDYVLEVESGFSERNKLAKGTLVDLTSIQK